MKKFSLKNHIGILFSVIDENGVLTEIKGSERRVSNIKINGSPIDVDKYYTLASNNYTILENGDGNTAFKGETIELEQPVKDVDALALYLESLGGVVPDSYSDIYGEDRIRFVSESEEPTAPQKISVLISGDELSCDTEAYIKNNTVFVPARAIFEALGAEVGFNAETKTVTAKKDDMIAEITIGSSTAVINGKTSPVLMPAEIKQSRTTVPLRFVSDIFNAQTNWESDTKTVVISAE